MLPQIVPRFAPENAWDRLARTMARFETLMIQDIEDIQRFRAWLGQQPVPQLVEWLVEAGFAHRPILVALTAAWECGAGDGWKPDPVREAIRCLTEPPAVATWRESDAIGNQVAPIGSLLRHVLEEKHAADAVGLAEYALERIAELSMGTQDSEVWSVPLLDDVGELHRKACLEARPDPVLLARRWKRFRGRWSFPVFDRFPAAYEQILGPDGLNEWQRSG